MHTMRGLIAVVSLMASMCGPAWARDIHVSNVAGDDRYLGRQVAPTSDGAGPLKTLNRALAIADSGDRIVVANTGRPYRESLSLVGRRHSGSQQRPFTIEGNGALLEGAEPVPETVWQHSHETVYRFQPRDMVYEQMFLHGKPVPRAACRRPDTFPVELGPIEWCLHGGSIYFRTEPYKQPQDYPLTMAARRVGITLFSVEHVEVRNFTIQGFQLDGLSAHNSAREIVLRQITCRGNARAGVSVGGASLVNIENCLLGDNGEAQLLTHPYSRTYVLNSQLLSNTAPAWVDRGGAVFADGKKVEDGLDEWKPAGDSAPNTQEER